MSADFEGNDKDAVVTQQVLDVIDSYGFKKVIAVLTCNTILLLRK